MRPAIWNQSSERSGDAISQSARLRCRQRVDDSLVVRVAVRMDLGHGLQRHDRTCAQVYCDRGVVGGDALQPPLPATSDLEQQRPGAVGQCSLAWCKPTSPRLALAEAVAMKITCSTGATST